MNAEALIETQVPALVRFFKNKSVGDVEDLVQETLSRCIARSSTRREGSSLRAFVFGVARNVLYEALRDKYRQQGRVLDESVSSVADIDRGVSTLLRHGNEKALLLEGLRRLTLEEQTVLEMFYWECMTARDIAEIMGTAENTIWTKLHRSRRKLAQDLGRQAPGRLAASEQDLDVWAKAIRDDWTV